MPQRYPDGRAHPSWIAARRNRVPWQNVELRVALTRLQMQHVDSLQQHAVTRTLVVVQLQAVDDITRVEHQKWQKHE